MSEFQVHYRVSELLKLLGYVLNKKLHTFLYAIGVETKNSYCTKIDLKSS